MSHQLFPKYYLGGFPGKGRKGGSGCERGGGGGIRKEVNYELG